MMRYFLAAVLTLVATPSFAASDWDEGWDMMRGHLCAKRRLPAPKVLDHTDPGPHCILNGNCRMKLREDGSLTGIADGAEMFAWAFIENRNAACKHTLPEWNSKSD